VLFLAGDATAGLTAVPDSPRAADSRPGTRRLRSAAGRDGARQPLKWLKLYRVDCDGRLRALRPQPVHDRAWHAADAFRYLAPTFDRKTVQAGFHRRIEYSRQGVV
jgi:hypothetical protein